MINRYEKHLYEMFNVGDRVEHNAYGKGTIVHMFTHGCMIKFDEYIYGIKDSRMYINLSDRYIENHLCKLESLDAYQEADIDLSELI